MHVRILHYFLAHIEPLIAGKTIAIGKVCAVRESGFRETDACIHRSQSSLRACLRKLWMASAICLLLKQTHESM